MQIEFDFTEHISFQNNAESQRQIEDGMKHFAGQAQTVFEHLMSGDSIDGDMARAMYKIRDIRPRIATIKNAGFLVAENKIPFSHGAKVWHMEQWQIKENKNKLEQSKK